MKISRYTIYLIGKVYTYYEYGKTYRYVISEPDKEILIKLAMLGIHYDIRLNEKGNYINLFIKE